ncbi:hypothetical protein JCM33374_g555 [Metschnikowia sp. JCM 33374]|nr:hypothetical protein JCM33374_g555 [Metschnikowia sp. JCM 33374]
MNTDLPADVGTDVLNHGQKFKTRTKTNISPSDPQFDRSIYSDSEYIELLKLEIRELQDQICQQHKLIGHLRQPKTAAEPTSPNHLSSEIFIEQKSPLARVVSQRSTHGRFISQASPQGSDIPQRSARRNDEYPFRASSGASKLGSPKTSDRFHNRRHSNDSIASITSNGAIDVSEGMLLSPDLKTELNAAACSTIPPEDTSSDDTETKSVFSDFETRSHGVVDPGQNDSERIRPPTAENSQPYSISNLSNHSTNPGDHTEDQSSSHSIHSFKSRARLPLTRGISETSRNEIEHLRSTDWRDNGRLLSPQVPGFGSGLQISSSESLLGENSSKEEGIKPNSSLDHPHQATTSPAIRESDFTSTSSLSSPKVPSESASFKDGGTNFGQTQTPKSHTLKSSESLSRSRELPGQMSGSSFSVLPSMAIEEDDVSLFIKPKDFSTVRIKVVSTITVNSKRADDYNCTFSINDKETNKEMWRFRKSFNQIVSFDLEVRPFIEFFGLPPLPEKSAFSSATPVKVDLRSQALQKYFDTIFLMPHIPQMVLLRICKYISVDFVNPLDDYRSGAKKEGFLIRRYKGLGATWKVRWCQIDGPELEIYDLPGGSLIEQIKLTGSQIGRQSSDSASEDRGYRHAFLILESSKSSKLSGYSPKHFFCAESDFERDEWIAAMVEFTDNDPLANDEKIGHMEIPRISTDAKESIQNEFEDTEHDSFSRQSNHSTGSRYSLAQVTADDAEYQTGSEDPAHKQPKKTKMRHLFPFRSKYGQIEDPTVASPSTVDSFSSLPSPDTTMQNYLSKLDLSEESSKAIFGRELKYAYELSNHEFDGIKIPSICFRCFDFLKKTGAIYEEGIFRLSGSASTIRSLKDNFNSCFDLDLFESPLKPDIHTVSGLLKTYLRELPHSLFGETTYHEMQRIVTENSKQHSQSQISLMVKQLLRSPASMDEVHYNFCLVVLGFLRSVVANSPTNKMSLKNVCIVFVPTLNISVDVLSLCLIDYDCIFGDSAPAPDHEREVLDLQIPLF